MSLLQRNQWKWILFRHKRREVTILTCSNWLRLRCSTAPLPSAHGSNPLSRTLSTSCSHLQLTRAGLHLRYHFLFVFGPAPETVIKLNSVLSPQIKSQKKTSQADGQGKWKQQFQHLIQTCRVMSLSESHRDRPRGTAEQQDTRKLPPPPINSEDG